MRPLTEILKDAKEYIEAYETGWRAERNDNRSLGQLVADGAMPKFYAELCELLGGKELP